MRIYVYGNHTPDYYSDALCVSVFDNPATGWFVKQYIRKTSFLLQAHMAFGSVEYRLPSRRMVHAKVMAAADVSTAYLKSLFTEMTLVIHS